MLKPFATRSHEEMKVVLKNPEETGPEIHYYMIRGGVDKENITVWEVGKVGDEYIKTFGHYHVGEISESYTILQGEGVILLQKLKKGNEEIVDEFYAVSVKTGDKLFIPSGMGHLVANTGSVWLVTSDNSPVNFAEADPVSLPGHADYKMVEKMHGFGYYLVEKEGKPTLVENPNYSNPPEPVWLSPEEWNQRFSGLSKT